jgi:hypothetical protein
MLSQDDAHRLPAYPIDDAALDGALGQQANRPPGAAFRRRAAHKGDERRLLRAVELGRTARPRLLGQGVLEAPGEVAPRDARDLTRVRFKRLRSRVHGHPAVEHQQRLNPSPNSRRPALALAAASPKLPPIGIGQLQSAKPLRTLHSTL